MRRPSFLQRGESLNCTSGRAIPEIGLKDNKPCGKPLARIAYRTASGETRTVLLCPKCDDWPTQKESA